ncbi:MAG: hypothetical protein CL609_23075 [Anaerolineaceae bacterium]|nr:hypothetical protein [Anaerolineaceae bacterium]
MKSNEIPLLEFDSTSRAILNPDAFLQPNQIPERLVLCFFGDVIRSQLETGKLTHRYSLRSEMGEHPIYIYHDDAFPGEDIAVLQPGVGAPLAVGMLEEAIQLGTRFAIACGGCGVLDDHVDVGHPFIVSSAVRDEGTSFHYLEPSREAFPHPDAVRVLEETLRENEIIYNLSKTWTTDAIYRETVKRREKRLEEGCEVVEMEASAFFAVAQFRQIKFGQILYGGDLVKPEGWDGREWVSRVSSRRLLFDLAVSAVRKLK